MVIIPVDRSLGRRGLPLPGRGWRSAHGRVLALRSFADDLPRGRCRNWLNNLGGDDQLFLDQEHATVIPGGTCVVRAGCDRDHLVCRELVDCVKWVLMGTHDHADLVLLEELVDDVWSVAHDIV